MGGVGGGVYIHGLKFQIRPFCVLRSRSLFSLSLFNIFISFVTIFSLMLLFQGHMLRVGILP